MGGGRISLPLDKLHERNVDSSNATLNTLFGTARQKSWMVGGTTPVRPTPRSSEAKTSQSSSAINSNTGSPEKLTSRATTVKATKKIDNEEKTSLQDATRQDEGTLASHQSHQKTADITDLQTFPAPDSNNESLSTKPSHLETPNIPSTRTEILLSEPDEQANRNTQRLDEESVSELGPLTPEFATVEAREAENLVSSPTPHSEEDVECTTSDTTEAQINPNPEPSITQVSGSKEKLSHIGLQSDDSAPCPTNESQQASSLLSEAPMAPVADSRPSIYRINADNGVNMLYSEVETPRIKSSQPEAPVAVAAESQTATLKSNKSHENNTTSLVNVLNQGLRPSNPDVSSTQVFRSEVPTTALSTRDESCMVYPTNEPLQPTNLSHPEAPIIPIPESENTSLRSEEQSTRNAQILSHGTQSFFPETGPLNVSQTSHNFNISSPMGSVTAGSEILNVQRPGEISHKKQPVADGTPRLSSSTFVSPWATSDSNSSVPQIQNTSTVSGRSINENSANFLQTSIPPITSLKSYLVLIEAQLKSVGGMESLNTGLERPRFQLITEACNYEDLFYVILHQLFVAWDLKPREVLSLPGVPDPKILQSGFAIIGKLIHANDQLAPNHKRWFADFPCSLSDFRRCSDHKKKTFFDVLACLEKLSNNWLNCMLESKSRGFPLLVDEITAKLGIFSPILQGVLFTATRRNMGIRDEKTSHEMDQIFKKDQSEYQIMLSRFGTANSPTLAELQGRNNALIHRYQSIYAQHQRRICGTTQNQQGIAFHSQISGPSNPQLPRRVSSPMNVQAQKHLQNPWAPTLPLSNTWNTTNQPQPAPRLVQRSVSSTTPKSSRILIGRTSNHAQTNFMPFHRLSLNSPEQSTTQLSTDQRNSSVSVTQNQPRQIPFSVPYTPGNPSHQNSSRPFQPQSVSHQTQSQVSTPLLWQNAIPQRQPHHQQLHQQLQSQQLHHQQLHHHQLQGQQLQGQQLQGQQLQGQQLQGQQLQGQQLQGQQLQGQQLQGQQLQGQQLQGQQLQGQQLQGQQLQGQQLQGQQLQGQQLQGQQLQGQQLQGQQLQGQQLQGQQLQGQQLQGQQLQGQQLQGQQLQGQQLQGQQLQGQQLQGQQLQGQQLQGQQLQGQQLQGQQLQGQQLQGQQLQGQQLQGQQLQGQQLQGQQLQGQQLQGQQLQGQQLQGQQLQGQQLQGQQLQGQQLQGQQLQGQQLQGQQLQGQQLQGQQLQGQQLQGQQLQGQQLHHQQLQIQQSQNQQQQIQAQQIQLQRQQQIISQHHLTNLQNYPLNPAVAPTRLTNSPIEVQQAVVRNTNSSSSATVAPFNSTSRNRSVGSIGPQNSCTITQISPIIYTNPIQVQPAQKYLSSKTKDEILLYHQTQVLNRTIVPPLNWLHPPSMLSGNRPEFNALHQALLRSPQLVASSLSTTDSSQKRHTARYYQAVRGFVLPPTIIPNILISKFEFRVSETDICCIPLDKFPKNGNIPTREFERGTLQFRLRCVQIKKPETNIPVHDWMVKSTTWPEGACFDINKNHLEIRRKKLHGKDLPIDITQNVLQNGTMSPNVVTLSISGGRTKMSECNYLLAVEIVEILEHSQILELCQKFNRVSTSNTLDKIKKSLASPIDDEFEMTICEISIDLADPYSSQIFKIPVRGRSCLHRECFDLETFLETRPSKPNRSAQPCLVDIWKCPLCGRDARPWELQIDEYLESVRKTLAEQDKLDVVKSIRVKPDGTWYPRVEKRKGISEQRESENSQAEQSTSTRNVKQKKSIEIISLDDDDE